MNITPEIGRKAAELADEFRRKEAEMSRKLKPIEGHRMAPDHPQPPERKSK